MKKVYSELLVSAYQLYEHISVYVVNDQAELTISYNIDMQVVLWNDVRENHLMLRWTVL